MTALFSITINDIAYAVAPVRYKDIQAGDTIIHIWDDTKHYGAVPLWLGEATHGELDWYGPNRSYALRNEDGTYTIQSVRTPVSEGEYGYVIASPWHETETGHSLYRLVK